MFQPLVGCLLALGYGIYLVYDKLPEENKRQYPITNIGSVNSLQKGAISHQFKCK